MAKTYDLTNDLINIHSLDRSSIDSILNYLIVLITDYVSISKKDFDDVTKIDLGIGELTIEFNNLEDKEFTYTFVPSENFLSQMQALYNNGFESKLSDLLRRKINNKLTSVYKGLLR